MSTNFYLVEPGKVFHPDESIHIGKSTAGTFNFQGYRDSTFDGPVESWAQWRRIISAVGEVWNEYGVRISAEDFFPWVEDKDPARRSEQYSWMVEHAKTDPIIASFLKNYWTDPEGYTFTTEDFF